MDFIQTRILFNFPCPICQYIILFHLGHFWFFKIFQHNEPTLSSIIIVKCQNSLLPKKCNILKYQRDFNIDYNLSESIFFW